MRIGMTTEIFPSPVLLSHLDLLRVPRNVKMHQVQVHRMGVAGDVPDLPFLGGTERRVFGRGAVPGDGAFHLASKPAGVFRFVWPVDRVGYSSRWPVRPCPTAAVSGRTRPCLRTGPPFGCGHIPGTVGLDTDCELSLNSLSGIWSSRGNTTSKGHDAVGLAVREEVLGPPRRRHSRRRRARHRRCFP